MSFIIAEVSLFMDHNDFYCMCNSAGDCFWKKVPIKEINEKSYYKSFFQLSLESITVELFTLEIPLKMKRFKVPFLPGRRAF